MPKKKGDTTSKQDANKLVISLLTENFVNLQRSFAQLTQRFDNLAGQISALLRLFEISAKNIAEKPELGFEKDFTNKLNALLDQNKVIAKAISIIEERTRQPAPMQPVQMQYPQQQRPMPVMPQRTMPQPAQPAGMMPVPEEYTQSSFAPERKPRPLPQV
jgi:hypothetical protein